MIADYHRQAIAANAGLGARLVAMGHYRQDRFAEIGDRFGVPCLNEADLLACPGVDVICICTPSGQHAEQAIAAAAAGKHMLVEKPIAVDLGEADNMIAACDKARVRLGVTLQRRALPLFKKIHKAIETGDLGKLVLATITMPYHRPQEYYDQAAWRGTWALDGGGVLMNQGIHLVDLLVWYMGDPVQVHARAGTLYHDIEVEDVLAATLTFDNGAEASITATTNADPGAPHRLELYGTRGYIQIEGEAAIRWELADPGGAVVAPPTTGCETSAGASADPRGIQPTGHIGIFRDFILALREDRPFYLDGFEGRRSLAAVLAIYEAADIRPKGR
ncbi:MAG: Gfo/Idh/MocA family oxidoreductase [Fidelibacterota bacterium]|nr:MAG: Gfo/Idh/MocA family oxidoreductase [Candidatus Neomarinimicrobiota bacterium]